MKYYFAFSSSFYYHDYLTYVNDYNSTSLLIFFLSLNDLIQIKGQI